MGDTDGFLSMGVIGSKFYFNKMTPLTMWKACGPEAKLAAKKSVNSAIAVHFQVKILRVLT